jgi:hypothetical protein
MLFFSTAALDMIALQRIQKWTYEGFQPNELVLISDRL